MATNFVLIVTKQAGSVVIVTVFVKNVIYCSICFFSLMKFCQFVCDYEIVVTPFAYIRNEY